MKRNFLFEGAYIGNGMKQYLNTLLAVVFLGFLLASCSQPATVSYEEQYDLGVRYLSEGNYEEAVLAFSVAIEIDPKHEAVVLLAESYLGSGDMENAIKTYLLAIDSEASKSPPYLALAQIYIDANDMESAETILTRGYQNTQSQEIADMLSLMISRRYDEVLDLAQLVGEWELGSLLDGSVAIYRLKFEENGKMTYHVGYYESEWISVYEGNYHLDENMISFNLTGEDLWDPGIQMPPISASYQASFTEDNLMMSWMSGDSFSDHSDNAEVLVFRKFTGDNSNWYDDIANENQHQGNHVFETYFKENPIDKAMENDWRFSSSTTDIRTAFSEYGDIWLAETLWAYDELIATAKGDEKTRFQEQRFHFEQNHEVAVQKELDAYERQGGSIDIINISGIYCEYYRVCAKEVYRQLYSYNTAYQYYFH